VRTGRWAVLGAQGPAPSFAPSAVSKLAVSELTNGRYTSSLASPGKWTAKVSSPVATAIDHLVAAFDDRHFLDDLRLNPKSPAGELNSSLRQWLKAKRANQLALIGPKEALSLVLKALRKHSQQREKYALRQQALTSAHAANRSFDKQPSRHQKGEQFVTAEPPGAPLR
jgi:hypothetical protein